MLEREDLFKGPDILTILLGFFLSMLALGGWVANIVKLMDSTGFGWVEVTRILGVFLFPLGSIMGFV